MRSSGKRSLEIVMNPPSRDLQTQPFPRSRPAMAEAGSSTATSPAPEQSYCRARDLPRLVALWPREIDDCSDYGHRKLLAKLRCALREERRRGLAGHWTYDVARHAGLLRAYRHELTSRGASRAPSSWPVATGRPHSSAPPSDSRGADSTWCDTRPARACNACAGDASGI
jgi:hypothetical protein